VVQGDRAELSSGKSKGGLAIVERSFCVAFANPWVFRNRVCDAGRLLSTRVRFSQMPNAIRLAGTAVSVVDTTWRSLKKIAGGAGRGRG